MPLTIASIQENMPIEGELQVVTPEGLVGEFLKARGVTGGGSEALIKTAGGDEAWIDFNDLNIYQPEAAPSV